jgi:hypothetical protein
MLLPRPSRPHRQSATEHEYYDVTAPSAAHIYIYHTTTRHAWSAGENESYRIMRRRDGRRMCDERRIPRPRRCARHERERTAEHGAVSREPRRDRASCVTPVAHAPRLLDAPPPPRSSDRRRTPKPERQPMHSPSTQSHPRGCERGTVSSGGGQGQVNLGQTHSRLGGAMGASASPRRQHASSVPPPYTPSCS